MFKKSVLLMSLLTATTLLSCQGGKVKLPSIESLTCAKKVFEITKESNVITIEFNFSEDIPEGTTIHENIYITKFVDHNLDSDGNKDHMGNLTLNIPKKQITCVFGYNVPDEDAAWCTMDLQFWLKNPKAENGYKIYDIKDFEVTNTIDK